MFRLAIIIGSTRPGRNGEAVAKWIYEIARQRKDTEVELVDIRDYNLPLLDEPQPASTGQYTQAHTRKWSEKIISFDGFVFVTPEYNHAPPAALKNAIDYLFHEWNNKSAGFVGYGTMGAVESCGRTPYSDGCPDDCGRSCTSHAFSFRGLRKTDCFQTESSP